MSALKYYSQRHHPYHFFHIISFSLENGDQPDPLSPLASTSTLSTLPNRPSSSHDNAPLPASTANTTNPLTAPPRHHKTSNTNTAAFHASHSNLHRQLATINYGSCTTPGPRLRKESMALIIFSLLYMFTFEELKSSTNRFDPNWRWRIWVCVLRQSTIKLHVYLNFHATRDGTQNNKNNKITTGIYLDLGLISTFFKKYIRKYN